MIGYTGASEKDVVEFLTENNYTQTFAIIKDVTGDFWSPTAGDLQNFIPGRGYLMFNQEPA